MPRKDKPTQHKLHLGQADVIVDTDTVTPEHFIQAGLNEHVNSLFVDFPAEIQKLTKGASQQ